MYSRMDKYHGQKVQRFSIRKYSFGAASVAVAAYMMFGGAATVQAHEQGTSATVTSEQVNTNAGNQADSTKPVDSTETSASTVATPTTEQAAAPVTATPAPEVAPAEPTKAVEAPVAKADTSKLEAAIPELQANIEKIKAEKAKEEAKPQNKRDQGKIDLLAKIITKAEGVVTTANAADATSAQKMSQQAEAVKSERDLLALYLAGKADLGAPVSENHVAYGNNPTNGVFESLKEGFGNKVTFDDVSY